MSGAWVRYKEDYYWIHDEDPRATFWVCWSRSDDPGRIEDLGPEIPIHWNGAGLHDSWPWKLSFRWRWVNVAWACCCVDAMAGLSFASAILEADEGDDAPALIACDWLEETGATVKLELATAPTRNVAILRSALGLRDMERCSRMPAGEFVGRSIYGSRSMKHWSVRWPIGWWARSMIEAHCVFCGHRKDAPPGADPAIPCGRCGKMRPLEPCRIDPPPISDQGS